MLDGALLRRLTVRGALRVPEVTVYFWGIKALSTATPRREAFHWGAVVATFALGTTIGDLTAYTVGLGYFASGLVFAAVITIPALGYWRRGWNAILAFWFAYVVTRPLGASFADWMGKPRTVGGLGWGSGTVALALAIIIFALVAFLAITRRDVQSVERGSGEARFRPMTASSETIE